MRYTTPVLAILFAATSILGCAGSKQLKGEALEAHMTERLGQFAAAFNGTSIDTIMAFFTEDPEVVPGGQSMKGLDNVRMVMSQSLQQNGDIVLSAREVVEGDGTFEQRGRYLIDTGDLDSPNGGFVANWVLGDDGVWRVAKLTWTQG